jgi:hypothetical protein
MDVDAFLADTVQSAGGKLSAFGIGWRVLSVGAVPARHDRVGLGVFVRLGGADAPAHRLEVRLLDPAGHERALGRGPDGADIAVIQAPFEVPGVGERTATFALNLDGLVFDREGTYTFAIRVDGLEGVRLAFDVQTRPEAPTAEYRGGGYL